VAAVTAAAHLSKLHQPAVGFLFLLTVLFLSLWGGLAVGMATSVLATACYNFFFLPPLYTFSIADPENWVGLAAFLVTSVVVSRLVVHARLQAEHAEARRREVEALAAERERLLAESAHLEALRESDELKTALLQAVSHDLTTPLTAISLHTEALRREAASEPELLAAADAIAAETARLHRRVDNLLAMARLESGRLMPCPEPTPPADLFRAVREHLPLVVARRSVVVRVAEDCPDAEVDPSLALEIVVNLVENAHRAAPAETAIELVAGRHPEDPGRVRLAVLDRGPGIAVDGEGRAGASGDPLRAGDIAQRGLGLEIARSLAAASQGALGLRNRSEGGTVAWVDLPAAAAAASETQP
jgi:two-component system sensor histidine kinase KdpD